MDILPQTRHWVMLTELKQANKGTFIVALLYPYPSTLEEFLGCKISPEYLDMIERAYFDEIDPEIVHH